MFLTIAMHSELGSIENLSARMARLKWRDGRESAGATASAVKRNERAELTGAIGRELHGDLQRALLANPVLRAAARPRRWSGLTITRTSSGGHYGPHIDNAVMGAGDARLRSDLSFTWFLNDSEEYDGGELIVEAPGTSVSFKQGRGELVLYPSSSIHEVAPVTTGERIVCVGWIESMIADPARRELLFDLENTRTTLRQTHGAQSPEMLTLDKSIANLLRMWVQV